MDKSIDGKDGDSKYPNNGDVESLNSPSIGKGDVLSQEHIGMREKSARDNVWY